MTVWKYTLLAADLQRIEMPAGAQILHVAEQHGELCMWALVDPDEPPVAHRFTVIGTGHIAPSRPAAYVGSALMLGGSLVWHVFEVPA